MAPVFSRREPPSPRSCPAANGSAVVARASFLGATVRVEATLPDGVEVTSILPASEGYTLPPGAPVDIELTGDVLFVVDRSGLARCLEVALASNSGLVGGCRLVGRGRGLLITGRARLEYPVHDLS